MVDSGLVARRVGQTWRVLAASPAYLAEHGTPAHPADLTKHRMIAFQALTPTRNWVLHAPNGQPLAIEVDPRLKTDSGDAAIEHTAAGGGITAVFWYQVHFGVRSGTLVEVLPAYASPSVPISAVLPTSRLLSNAVRAFIEVIKQDAEGWTVLSQNGFASSGCFDEQTMIFQPLGREAGIPTLSLTVKLRTPI